MTRTEMNSMSIDQLKEQLDAKQQSDLFDLMDLDLTEAQQKRWVMSRLAVVTPDTIVGEQEQNPRAKTVTKPVTFSIARALRDHKTAEEICETYSINEGQLGRIRRGESRYNDEILAVIGIKFPEYIQDVKYTYDKAQGELPLDETISRLIGLGRDNQQVPAQRNMKDIPRLKMTQDDFSYLFDLLELGWRDIDITTYTQVNSGVVGALRHIKTKYARAAAKVKYEVSDRGIMDLYKKFNTTICMSRHLTLETEELALAELRNDTVKLLIAKKCNITKGCVDSLRYKFEQDGSLTFWGSK